MVVQASEGDAPRGMANPEESNDEGMKVDEEPIWEGPQPDIDVDLGDKPLSAAISDEGAAPEAQGAKWIGMESRWVSPPPFLPKPHSQYVVYDGRIKFGGIAPGKGGSSGVIPVRMKVPMLRTRQCTLIAGGSCMRGVLGRKGHMALGWMVPTAWDFGPKSALGA
eukprot:1084476-Amphidinium_carterae.1